MNEVRDRAWVTANLAWGQLSPEAKEGITKDSWRRGYMEGILARDTPDLSELVAKLEGFDGRRLHEAADESRDTQGRMRDVKDHDELHAAGALLDLLYGQQANLHYLARWVQGLWLETGEPGANPPAAFDLDSVIERIHLGQHPDGECRTGATCRRLATATAVAPTFWTMLGAAAL